MLYQAKRIVIYFPRVLPTSSDDLTQRLALSISVINEVCVVSRSAAWPLKLALFPAP